jgi:hypothetical protein
MTTAQGSIRGRSLFTPFQRLHDGEFTERASACDGRRIVEHGGRSPRSLSDGAKISFTLPLDRDFLRSVNRA